MAKKIICTDADVNDCVLNFFNMLDVPYKLLCNQYKQPLRGKYYQCSEEMIYNKLKIDVEQENYTFCASDSKKTTNMIFLFLRGLGVKKDDIILVNRDETERNKEIYNTELWHDKHVIISPSVTIGVDFVPSKARNIYSFAEGGSINPLLILQQIFRCRKINDIYTYIKPSPKPPTIFSMNQVAKVFDNIKPVEL